MSFVYQVIYQSHVQRILKKLDRDTQIQIFSEIDQLSKNPFRHPNIKRLEGISQPGFRLRIGRWRILYLLFHPHKTIEVIDVFMKKSAADYRRRLR